jgi:hydrogenase/urease accessory protein HupE
MKNLSRTLFGTMSAFPSLAHAHPGNHDAGAFAAWLRHMLSSPDHLPLLILAGLVIALGVLLMNFRDRG